MGNSQCIPETYGSYFKNVYPDGTSLEGYTKWFSIIMSKRYNSAGILIEEFDDINKIRRRYSNQGHLIEEVIGSTTYVYNEEGFLLQKITPTVKTIFRPDSSFIEETLGHYREYSADGRLVTERIYDENGCIGQIFENGRITYDSCLVREISNDIFERKLSTPAPDNKNK